jgi:hypothetical protein
MRKDEAYDRVRSLAGGSFDVGDGGDKAAGQDDDFNCGVGRDAERAIGVVLMRRVTVSQLHSGAEEQQQDAHDASEANVTPAEAAENDEHLFS